MHRPGVLVMKTLILTNEFPPAVYGGAGVHVEYLSRELAKLIDVEVRSFDGAALNEARLKARAFPSDTSLFDSPPAFKAIFGALQRCLDFNTTGIDAHVVHCHTWYTHFGGILAKLNYGTPLAITVHSLEPLRPWKRDQLGGGYDFTVWLERTALEMADAVITVSEGTRQDVLRLFDVDPSCIHVIHNGIDPAEFRRVEAPEALIAFGIDPTRPYVLFVGRITRQKGIVHLVRAIPQIDPRLQIVLCAGAPDTAEIASEMRAAVDEARAARDGVVWIEKMVSTPDKVALYSHASVFCCPSIYEPFGIINLEAMACETPVVAAAVGGIPEVVVDGETGVLVAVDRIEGPPYEPRDPAVYARDLADGINLVVSDPALADRMGKAGRERVLEKFSWTSIAVQTAELYRELAGPHPVVGTES